MEEAAFCTEREEEEEMEEEAFIFLTLSSLFSQHEWCTPKRDENSGELLVRFPEVSLPVYPFAHILLTLVPVIHPSLSP